MVWGLGLRQPPWSLLFGHKRGEAGGKGSPVFLRLLGLALIVVGVFEGWGNHGACTPLDWGDNSAILSSMVLRHFGQVQL